MSGEVPMKRCYACKGEKLLAVTADLERRIAGCTFKAAIPATRCAKCGEETYAGPDLEAFDLAVAGELASHGVGSAEAFSFMRRAMGMTGRDLAELLDVAPETVSRWEHGKLPLDRGPVALLSAMVLDQLEGRTTTLDRLKALLKPKSLPKQVRLVPRFA
jgi:putative zinc finger/helix-turn-helix YgiT family protein